MIQGLLNVDVDMLLDVLTEVPDNGPLIVPANPPPPADNPLPPADNPLPSADIPVDAPLMLMSPLASGDVPRSMAARSKRKAAAAPSPPSPPSPQVPQVPDFPGMRSASKYWFLPTEERLQMIGDHLTHQHAHCVLGIVGGGQAARTDWMRPNTLTPTPASAIPRVRYIYSMDAFPTGQTNMNASLLTNTLFDVPVIMEFEV